MNRNNIWIHIILALVLVGLAAVAGQVNSWVSNMQIADRQTNQVIPAPPPRIIPHQTGQADSEVLVKFKPNVSLIEIEKIALKNNDRIEDNVESVRGLVAIDDMDLASAEAVAAQYADMTDLVEYAEPNVQIKLDDPTSENLDDSIIRDNPPSAKHPSDPLFAEQWALNNVGQNGGKQKADIGALSAWQKTKGSKKVVVAVLDTGVDYNHEDLAANMWTRPANVPEYHDEELGMVNDLHGFDADADLSDPMDDNGHGTHCAGVIGAEGDNGIGVTGINWQVEIMPLKFLGRGGFGSTKNAIEAINYAIDRKKNGVNVRIISASWGSTSKSKALEDVIRAAGEAGILFIAAAGNDGSDNDKRPHYPSNYKLPNVISVAALDRNDNLASFSNWGVKTVHIAAPGKDISSTWIKNGYREASGTSMATPQVAGVAALILATDPDMSVEKLRERLLKSTQKLDSLNKKIESGGKLDAAKALED